MAPWITDRGPSSARRATATGTWTDPEKLRTPLRSRRGAPITSAFQHHRAINMALSNRPLPGSEPISRGLFIDRWGTLLELPKKGFCKSFSRARFTEGAIEALFRAAQKGWNIYLVGNEDAVAFGKQSEESYRAFEAELLDHLKQHGVPVKRSYSCLENPEGKAPHDGDSVFLFPNTGAFYHAAQNDGIELRDSWIVGDSTLELAAGWRAGAHVAGVRTGMGLGDGGLEIEPELLHDDLAGVVDELSQYEHLPR